MRFSLSNKPSCSHLFLSSVATITSATHTAMFKASVFLVIWHPSRNIDHVTALGLLCSIYTKREWCYFSLTPCSVEVRLKTPPISFSSVPTISQRWASRTNPRSSHWIVSSCIVLALWQEIVNRDKGLASYNCDFATILSFRLPQIKLWRKTLRQGVMHKMCKQNPSRPIMSPAAI